VPGARIAEYAERVGQLAAANGVLSAFHALRRQDIGAGGTPTIQESLARLEAQSRP